MDFTSTPANETKCFKRPVDETYHGAVSPVPRSFAQIAPGTPDPRHSGGERSVYKRPKLNDHGAFIAAAAEPAAPARKYILEGHERRRIIPNRASVAQSGTASAAGGAAASLQKQEQESLLARLKHHSGELLRMNELARQRLRRVAEKTRQLDEVRRDVSAAVCALRRRQALRGAARRVDTHVEATSLEDGDRSGVVNAAKGAAFGAGVKLRSARTHGRVIVQVAQPVEDDADSGERGRRNGFAAALADDSAYGTALVAAAEERWGEGEDADDDSRSSSSSGSVTGPRRVDVTASVLRRSLLGGAPAPAPCDAQSPYWRCSSDARDAWVGDAQQARVGDTRMRVSEGGYSMR